MDLSVLSERSHNDSGRGSGLLPPSGTASEAKLGNSAARRTAHIRAFATLLFGGSHGDWPGRLWSLVQRKVVGCFVGSVSEDRTLRVLNAPLESITRCFRLDQASLHTFLQSHISECSGTPSAQAQYSDHRSLCRGNDSG